MITSMETRTAIDTKRLGDVARFVRGITFTPDDVMDGNASEALLCMRTKNVQADLDLSDVWGIPTRFVKRSEQFLQAGDVLISSANSWNLVGKCCWVPDLDQQATFGGFVSVLRGDPTKVNLRYLYRWFSSSPVQETVRSFGRQTTNISNLDMGRCADMELPLPSLSDQRHIAAILDQADELRRKRRESLSLISSLVPSTFAEMFPSSGAEFNEARLEDVVAAGTIVTYGIVQAGEEYPGGTPYIRTGDIVDGEIQCSGLRHTNPAVAARFTRSRVETGEIVMSIRATVGTTALVPSILDGANLTQGTARIAPGERTNSLYLLNFLRSEEAQRWIQQQVKGATFREITLTRLRDLPVRLPPLSLQSVFAARATEIDRLKSAARSHLVKLDNLFASLQHRAFNGELTAKSAERELAEAV